MENKNLKDKLIKRLKSITTEGIVVIIVSLIMAIIDARFLANLIKALVNKQYMFDAKGPTNDIIILVLFSILFIAIILCLIYNLFIRSFTKLGPVTKDIVHGKVVERKTGRNETLKDVIKKESNNSSVEQSSIQINKDKLKENLKKDENKNENQVK